MKVDVRLFVLRCVFRHVAMVELDGDDIRISSRGKMAERDIVQVSLMLFVTFSRTTKTLTQLRYISSFSVHKKVLFAFNLSFV